LIPLLTEKVVSINLIEKELDSVEDLLVGWGQSLTSRSDILNFRSVADDPEASLLELRIDGEELWQVLDPVHGTAALYSGMAKLPVSYLLMRSRIRKESR
jgi:hypothetical protein